MIVMKTIYLIRHVENASEIAEKLQRPAKLYTSEQTAAMQTAQAICDKWHVRPEPLACLMERDYPKTVAASLAPPMMLGAPNLTAKPIDSESDFTFDDLNNHVETFLKIAPKFPHRTTCVVHATWLHLLLWRVLGFRADNADDIAAFHTWQAQTPNPVAWYLHIGDSWETWLQVLDLDSQK